MSITNGQRWASTFLSYDNVAHAIPDEVLINKENGRLYYKRLDGKVLDIFENFVIDGSAIEGSLIELREAIADGLTAAKQYTDERIQEGGGGTGGGSTKTVYHRFLYTTLTDGETEVAIPLSTHDVDTDLLILSVNITLPDSGYTVTNDKIIFDEGLDINTGIQMIIIKNVPIGDGGNVSGNMLSKGSITEDKLSPAVIGKLNGIVPGSGTSVIVSGDQPTDQPLGGLWLEVTS